MVRRMVRAAAAPSPVAPGLPGFVSPGGKSRHVAIGSDPVDDQDIRANRIQEIAFSSESGVEILPSGHALVEFQYAFEQPVFFKAIIEQFELEPQSISKYCLSVQALGLVEQAKGAVAQLTSSRRGGCADGR